MKKAFIFDMDGVIVDSEKFYQQTRLGFLKSVGLQPGVKDLQPYIGASFSDGWKMMVPDTSLWGDLLPRYKKYFSDHPIYYPDYVHPHVTDFFKALKKAGKIVTLASAGNGTLIKQMIRQCHFEPYFAAVLSGEDVSKNKPAPDIYLTSVQNIGLKPEECVALEDSPVGIRSAKAAGLETWALKYPGYQMDQSKANKIFNGFEDVNDYFAEKIG